MAVSVDTVYQRVLAILNKEQRGYVTPQEFNLFANQALMDIFEQYFYDINQFSRMHGNDTEYSDMLNVLNEKISLFEKQSTLAFVSSAFTLPSDLYRLGTIIYNNIEAERVNKNEYLYITSSPITAPSADFPIYTKDAGGVRVFANTELNGTATVKCNYIKKPAKVVWNYRIVFGEPLYNASTSVDFELHPSDETELVIKILELAGLLIKDISMYQIANQEEAETIQQEKL